MQSKCVFEKSEFEVLSEFTVLGSVCVCVVWGVGRGGRWGGDG